MEDKKWKKKEQSYGSLGFECSGTITFVHKATILIPEKKTVVLEECKQNQ